MDQNNLMTKYYNPVNIIKTNNWVFELKKNMEKLNISNPIIITSPGNKERINMQSLFNNNSIYCDFTPNPNFEDSKKVIEFCKDKKFDGVIAIGGGSAMDLAKLTKAYLCIKTTIISELISFSEPYPNNLPSIFIPTTHGTASEVTKWGTLWDMKGKKKFSISNPSLYPDVAILDGSILLSLPLDISIISSLDALSHSFESIWNVNANSESTQYAIVAICLILENIDDLKNDPSNLQTRNKLLEAANIAGLAFSSTATAAAHSISYPLTIHYNIPHGIASSLSLVPLLKINMKYIDKPLRAICKKSRFSKEELINKIENIPKNVIPFSLENWGVKISDLEQLTKESFTKGRMDNNIKTLTEINVREILDEIY